MPRSSCARSCRCSPIWPCAPFLARGASRLLPAVRVGCMATALLLHHLPDGGNLDHRSGGPALRPRSLPILTGRVNGLAVATALTVVLLTAMKPNNILLTLPAFAAVWLVSDSWRIGFSFPRDHWRGRRRGPRFPGASSSPSPTIASFPCRACRGSFYGSGRGELRCPTASLARPWCPRWSMWHGACWRSSWAATSLAGSSIPNASGGWPRSRLRGGRSFRSPPSPSAWPRSCTPSGSPCAAPPTGLLRRFNLSAIGAGLWLYRRPPTRPLAALFLGVLAVVVVQAFVYQPDQRFRVMWLDFLSAVVLGTAVSRHWVRDRRGPVVRAGRRSRSWLATTTT